MNERQSNQSDAFTKARQFILGSARLLERRIFSVRFEGADPVCVAQALRAYQNPDGGLGHALEPDLRCSESQPLFADFGLAALCEVGFRDPDLAMAICSFLAGVSDARGLVPVLLENARSAPHAPHWDVPMAPGPPFGICGLLHDQGIEHDWLDRATETCCAMLLSDTPLEAHALAGACRLAEHLPVRAMAERIADAIALALPRASFFIENAPVTTYGLTPLHFAPSPASPWRSLFTDDQIDSHLDDLLSKQEDDGGWPISWSPPGPLAHCEWRGCVTLEAITRLAAYNKI